MTLNQVCSTIIIRIQNEKTVDKKTSVTAIDIKFGCFLKRKLTAEAGHKAYSPWNDSPETKFWWKQWYKQVIEGACRHIGIYLNSKTTIQMF